MGKIIGIDLGTTNSCVAVYERGAVTVLENAEGRRTTPSVVAYAEDGAILVGEAAKRQIVTNPRNTLFAVKRLIGRRYDDPEVRRDAAVLPYKIVRAPNGDAWVSVRGGSKSPPQISAEVLRKMRKTAEDALGERITDAVVTVPAYFDDRQRKATKDAGRAAGLNVLRIINEPTAAALAYGLGSFGGARGPAPRAPGSGAVRPYDPSASGRYQVIPAGSEAPAPCRGARKIAVYDLGGGTFDVSIIGVDDSGGERTFEVLAASGDTRLGGEDFDDILTAYLIDVFRAENRRIDLRKDPAALQRVREAAEQAKIALSSAARTDVSLPYLAADSSGPRHLNVTLTREKLESLVGDLARRTLVSAERALRDAGLRPGDIDEVLLVGGQTRMPLVRRIVAEFFGREPRKDVNPDEAVAIGAAIQGSVLEGAREDVLLLDVTPLSLGTNIQNPRRFGPDLMAVVVERNTPIPGRKTRLFTTADDNQTAVIVKVLQGEGERAQDNTLLGEFILDGIVPAPAGTPEIDVTFEVDSDGLIRVSARDRKTGREQHITVRSPSGLSEREVRDLEDLAYARDRAEDLIYLCERGARERGRGIPERERASLGRAVGDLESAARGDDFGRIERAERNLADLAESLGLIARRRRNRGD